MACTALAPERLVFLDECGVLIDSGANGDGRCAERRGNAGAHFGRNGAMRIVPRPAAPAKGRRRPRYRSQRASSVGAAGAPMATPAAGVQIGSPDSSVMALPRPGAPAPANRP